MTGRKRLFLLFAVAPLAACAQQKAEPRVYVLNPPVVASVPAPPRPKPTGPLFAGKPPEAFDHCKACHSSSRKGPNGIGPNLWGVYGARVGRKAGYRFSDQLLASDLIWDEATLDRWLAGPKALVPGTRMTYSGMRDPEMRRAVIKYLKSLN